MTPPPEAPSNAGVKVIRRWSFIFLVYSGIMLASFFLNFLSPAQARKTLGEHAMVGGISLLVLSLYFAVLSIGFLLRLRFAWRAAFGQFAIIEIAGVVSYWPAFFGQPGAWIPLIILTGFFTFQTVQWYRAWKKHEPLFA
jgi:hypothetical protein